MPLIMAVNYKKMGENGKTILLYCGALGWEMLPQGQAFLHPKTKKHGKENRREQTSVSQKVKWALVVWEPIEKLILRYVMSLKV